MAANTVSMEQLRLPKGPSDKFPQLGFLPDSDVATYGIRKTRLSVLPVFSTVTEFKKQLRAYIRLQKPKGADGKRPCASKADLAEFAKQHPVLLMRRQSDGAYVFVRTDDKGEGVVCTDQASVQCDLQRLRRVLQDLDDGHSFVFGTEALASREPMCADEVSNEETSSASASGASSAAAPDAEAKDVVSIDGVVREANSKWVGGAGRGIYYLADNTSPLYNVRDSDAAYPMIKMFQIEGTDQVLPFWSYTSPDEVYTYWKKYEGDGQAEYERERARVTEERERDALVEVEKAGILANYYVVTNPQSRLYRYTKGDYPVVRRFKVRDDATPQKPKWFWSYNEPGFWNRKAGWVKSEGQTKWFLCAEEQCRDEASKSAQYKSEFGAKEEKEAEAFGVFAGVVAGQEKKSEHDETVRGLGDLFAAADAQTADSAKGKDAAIAAAAQAHAAEQQEVAKDKKEEAETLVAEAKEATKEASVKQDEADVAAVQAAVQKSQAHDLEREKAAAEQAQNAAENAAARKAEEERVAAEQKAKAEAEAQAARSAEEKHAAEAKAQQLAAEEAKAAADKTRAEEDAQRLQKQAEEVAAKAAAQKDEARTDVVVAADKAVVAEEAANKAEHKQEQAVAAVTEAAAAATVAQQAAESPVVAEVAEPAAAPLETIVSGWTAYYAPEESAFHKYDTPVPAIKQFLLKGEPRWFWCLPLKPGATYTPWNLCATEECRDDQSYLKAKEASQAVAPAAAAPVNTEAATVVPVPPPAVAGSAAQVPVVQETTSEQSKPIMADTAVPAVAAVAAPAPGDQSPRQAVAEHSAYRSAGPSIRVPKVVASASASASESAAASTSIPAPGAAASSAALVSPLSDADKARIAQYVVARWQHETSTETEKTVKNRLLLLYHPDKCAALPKDLEDLQASRKEVCEEIAKVLTSLVPSARAAPAAVGTQVVSDLIPRFVALVRGQDDAGKQRVHCLAQTAQRLGKHHDRLIRCATCPTREVEHALYARVLYELASASAQVLGCQNEPAQRHLAAMSQVVGKRASGATVSQSTQAYAQYVRDIDASKGQDSRLEKALLCRTNGLADLLFKQAKEHCSADQLVDLVIKYVEALAFFEQAGALAGQGEFYNNFVATHSKAVPYIVKRVEQVSAMAAKASSLGAPAPIKSEA